jgi:hypothetical protein
MSRTLGWVVAAAVVMTTLFAYAQESVPLGIIADLVAQKGYKDLPGGQLCDRFHVQGRVSDGKCALTGVGADESDYIDGYEPGLETYVEQGAGKRRIVLKLVANKLGRSYAFLTDDNGTLQQALSATLVKKLWQWSSVAIDDDIKARYAKVLAFWTTPKMKKEIEEQKG